MLVLIFSILIVSMSIIPFSITEQTSFNRKNISRLKLKKKHEKENFLMRGNEEAFYDSNF